MWINIENALKVHKVHAQEITMLYQNRLEALLDKHCLVF